MLAWTHPACLAHDTGPDHPEQPARLQVVIEALQHHCPGLDWREAPAAARGDLCRVHAAEMVDQVLAPVVSGIQHIDAETVVSPGSARAAVHAAGAGIAAVDAAMAGPERVAFCAVRPPGHHATADTPMRFCLLDNIAA